ncbi:NodT family efflux transporter outer membrane factor (OMF) lipoprotein [Caulobacter ginsengisoli]|uniref:NodT family efflux transporter outer membrane factor (OMF) lipoprotein n=1 Tax=Caulobacter ginsengisoli TaxID=400775 RepID=A0ABU0IXP6_9CAUL|nr:efflux transporter outer membrane subunit [Caulobacter ginsengisoli]MDQ0466778.1 NodT family efflux transporter outer membrane factor (OMF) lipoprotein [Caulobacter ginsengisoli]
MTLSSSLRGVSALAIVLALAGCVSTPDLGPKPKPLAAADLASVRSLAAPVADWPQDSWWTAYGDTQLSQLIEEALKTSPSLAQAQARMRKADAQVGTARSALLPQVSANGQVATTESSRNMGYPPFIQQQLPQGYQDNGRVTLDASWDLDLFGRNRAALASATSEAEAARADAAQVRLTLSTAVAGAYADLARLYAQRDAAEGALKVRQQVEDLVAQRVQNGLDSNAELDQAKAATPAARADLAALDEQIDIARHRLAALLGAGPDRGLDIARPGPTALKPFGLPSNLAVDLIGRRPDLVAARLRAQAASKRIDVAKADFYPNIDLSGYLGRQSLGIDLLTQPQSNIGNLGLALRLPIFQGGKLKAAYKGSRADYDAAVAAYDETLTGALRDVADAAATSRSVADQLASRQQALAAGENAWKLARLRYENGLSNYVAVLTAENDVLTQRRAVAELQARAFTADIALVRALGGGFTAN